MNVDESYLAVSGFFDLWVRLMEYRTRLMEVRNSRIGDSSILIISPPTDRGIRLLARANASGKSHLLCFSGALAKIAERYRDKHGIKGLEMKTAPFFSIPAADGAYDAVFGNCLFDFCRDEDIAPALQDVRRALRPGGRLFAVYMDRPKTFAGRAWAALFRRVPSISGGCRPIDMAPYFSESGFVVKEDESLTRLGFPLRYVVAER